MLLAEKQLCCSLSFVTIGSLKSASHQCRLLTVYKHTVKVKSYFLGKSIFAIVSMRYYYFFSAQMRLKLMVIFPDCIFNSISISFYLIVLPFYQTDSVLYLIFRSRDLIIKEIIIVRYLYNYNNGSCHP